MMTHESSYMCRREEELKQALAAVERLCTDGKGSTVAIEGPAGYGKSRLLQEVTWECSARGIRLLRTAAAAVEARPVRHHPSRSTEAVQESTPLWGLRGLLASIADVSSEEALWKDLKGLISAGACTCCIPRASNAPSLTMATSRLQLEDTAVHLAGGLHSTPEKIIIKSPSGEGEPKAPELSKADDNDIDANRKQLQPDVVAKTVFEALAERELEGGFRSISQDQLAAAASPNTNDIILPPLRHPVQVALIRLGPLPPAAARALFLSLAKRMTVQLPLVRMRFVAS
eukprot:tig00000137_g8132.t1